MIREFNLSDKEYILRLGKYITDDFDKVTNINEYISNKNKKIFVFLIEKKIVGFIIVHVLIGEIEIIDIVTDINYRRQKIASSLLTYIFKRYNKNIFLEVNVNNKDAISLYKKYNFRIINERKKYYNNIEDAYIMKRSPR